MKSIFTTILLCCCINAFAQTEKDETVVDDTYGKPKKSLIYQEPQKVNLNLPGNYLRKAGTSLSGAIVTAIMSGIIATVVAKQAPESAKYVYLGGSILTTGLFISSAVNLSKAGDELSKVLHKQSQQNKF